MFSNETSKYEDVKNLESMDELNPFDWNMMKDYVNIRMGNAIYLENMMPNDIIMKKWLDLGMTFTVDVYNSSKKLTKSHMLTEKDIEKLGITKKELEDKAMENMKFDSKFRLISFADSMALSHPLYPLLKRNAMASMQIPEIPFVLEDIKGFNPLERLNSENVKTDDEKENILFMTAKNKSFGAKFISSFDNLRKVYKRFNGENFYIVPLSIHQIMCIRNSYATHEGKKDTLEVEDDLLDLLLEYNDSVNKNEENILSYKIYYFSGDDGEILFPISRKKGA